MAVPRRTARVDAAQTRVCDENLHRPSGTHEQAGQAHVVTLRTLVFEALGSSCELFAVDADEGRLAEAAAWVRQMHQRLTRFDPTSELSRFNARPGEWIAITPELEALLREALAAYDRSGGLVHAGLLTRMLAIGYTRTFAEGPTIISAQGPARVPPLPDLLQVHSGEARLAPGHGIDLGGIAKGWLADRLVERLGQNALANLGGDLSARGAGPEADGWPVGFGAKTVLLTDVGVATSGTSRRRWGEGLHHLIDPRTGLPAVTDLIEVSVIARTGVEAEVLAKTALLLGSSGAPDFLRAAAIGWWLG